MKSETINQTFNGLTEWLVEGNYFKLLAAASPVRVELFLRGRLVLLATAATAGFYQRVQFDQVKITSSASLAVSFMAAPDEGGNDSFTGNVSINGLAHTQTAVTAGIASAQALAANANRKYLAIQNQSSSEDVYVRTDGGAAAVSNASFRVGPGQTWEPPIAPTGQVNVIRGAAADAAINVIEA